MTRTKLDEEIAVPFLLAGGDPNWMPRTPVMGFKRFEPKSDAQQAPRSRRVRRSAPTEPVLIETSDNDFE